MKRSSTWEPYVNDTVKWITMCMLTLFIKRRFLIVSAWATDQIRTSMWMTMTSSWLWIKEHNNYNRTYQRKLWSNRECTSSLCFHPAFIIFIQTHWRLQKKLYSTNLWAQVKWCGLVDGNEFFHAINHKVCGFYSVNHS